MFILSQMWYINNEKEVTKMSILNEYNEIKNAIGKEKFEQIEKFLESHKNYFLSDVYYNQKVYKEFEEWLKGAETKCQK